MAPKVDQCCCGCTLRTGAIFIAFYHMIMSTSVLIAASMLLYKMYCPPPHKNYHHTSTNGTTEVDGGREDKDGRKRKHEFLEGGLKALYIFAITIFALNFLVNMFLLIGVKREKPAYINVWIIVNSVVLMTSIVVLIINLFMTFLDPDPPLITMGISILSIVTTSYFIVVVNSMYHKLDRRRSAARNERPPPIVFIIDPTPPPPQDDLPPPYPSHLEETTVEPMQGTSKMDTSTL